MIKKNKSLIKNLSIKILLMIFISLLILTFFHLQPFFVVDKFLTLNLGWIRLFLYLGLILFSTKIIFNLSSLSAFNLKKILTFTFILLCLIYLMAAFIELWNNKFLFLGRETFENLKNKIQIYNDNYNQVILYGFLTLNCQAGILGIVFVWSTNYIGGIIFTLIFTIIISSLILLIFLYFLGFKKPFFAIKISFSKIKIKLSLIFKKRKYKFNKIALIFKKRKYKFNKDNKILYFFKKHNVLNYQEIFNDANFYKEHWKISDKNNNFQGIYAFYVKDFYGKEKVFLPCYVGKSRDIMTRWKSHAKKIDYAYNNPNKISESLAVYQRVSTFLHTHKLTPNDLRFVVLEWVPSDNKLGDAESFWINQIGTIKRGWNSIRA